jgi:hypothetical protein
MRKRHLWTTLISLSIVVMTNTSFAASNPPVSVDIDGQVQAYDQPPILAAGRVYVPIRATMEHEGAHVAWDGIHNTVEIVKENQHILYSLNDRIVKVNGDVQYRDVNYKMVNGRVLIPVRLISELLTMKVDWSQDQNTVFIKSDKYLAEMAQVKNILQTAAVKNQNFTTLFYDVKAFVGSNLMQSYHNEIQPNPFFVYTTYKELTENREFYHDMDTMYYRDIGTTQWHKIPVSGLESLWDFTRFNTISDLPYLERFLDYLTLEDKGNEFVIHINLDNGRLSEQAKNSINLISHYGQGHIDSGFGTMVVKKLRYNMCIDKNTYFVTKTNAAFDLFFPPRGREKGESFEDSFEMSYSHQNDFKNRTIPSEIVEGAIK